MGGANTMGMNNAMESDNMQRQQDFSDDMAQDADAEGASDFGPGGPDSPPPPGASRFGMPSMKMPQMPKMPKMPSMPWQRPPPPLPPTPVGGPKPVKFDAKAMGMALDKEIKVQNMLVTATELESKLRKLAAKAGVPLDELMSGKKEKTEGKGKDGKGKGKDGKGPATPPEDVKESASSLIHTNKKTKKAAAMAEDPEKKKKKK